MTITFAHLDRSNADEFGSVADDVFDAVVSPRWLESFLNDPRHHLVVARADESIIGFVSAVDYVHPDKPREMWINEVGVAADWHGQGIAKRMLSMMLDHARILGCAEAWVLADPENRAANALYRSVAAPDDPQPSVAIMHSFKLA